MSSTITVKGLTQLEVRELEEKLGDRAVKEVGNVSPDARFPEPATFFVAMLALSSLALTSLAIILARPKAKTRRVFTLVLTEGNKTVSATYDEEIFAVGPPPAEVIEKIGKALSFDPKSLPETAMLE